MKLNILAYSKLAAPLFPHLKRNSGILMVLGMCPARVLITQVRRFWISEGLTQAES